MQHKFNYVKGLTHGAYQFSYQHKEQPIYYKFQYKKGICHGAYKFMYGEKEKPIYVENSFSQYTYWDREIDVEQSMKQYNYWGRGMSIQGIARLLTFKAATIYSQKTVDLRSQTINQIEQNKVFDLESKEHLENFTNQNSLLFDEWSKEFHKSQHMNLEVLKKQLNLLSQVSLLKNEELHMDTSQREYLLAVLKDVKSEVYRDILLSLPDLETHIENHEYLKKIGYDIEALKPINLNSSCSEIDIASNEVFYTNLLKKVQIEAVMALEKVFEKEIACFLGRLNQLIRINSFDLHSQHNIHSMERTTDIRLHVENSKFMGIKQKNNDEIEITGTKHFAHKYLELQSEKIQRLSKKFKSYRLDVPAFLDSKIEKDLLQEIYTALERNIFKDALKMTSDKLLDKKVTRQILNIGLERYLEKEVFKEFTTEHLETFLEKVVIKELATQVHTQLLDLLHHNKLLKDNVIQQLEASTDYFLSLYINKANDGLIKEQKYQFLTDKLIKGLIKKFKALDETIALNLEAILRDILKQDITPLDDVARSLIQEDSSLLNKNLLIQLEESERKLKLYKRFWIVGNSDFKDLMILPDHDYPYSTEPIIENMDLIPENHHVVYPNEFYKCIDKHPIPNGKGLALDEIGVSINILIDLINIFIMMWCKFTPAFWGWTGTQAVLGMVDSIYEFITLETSREWQQKEDVKEQYDRAYKWIRWEGEKMALFARHDMDLRGNYYVGLMLEELIFYMVDHHFDVLPLFEDVNKMDEWRTMFNRDVNKDIKFVLDKVKGIRHKILEKEVRPYES